MICSRCGSASHCKAGVINGRQRYKCKECGYYYTVEKKSDVKPVETRRMALEMYLEGVGFRAIGRLLKISYGTVYQWIKKWGRSHDLPVGNDPLKVVELDEMHTYVGEKKTTDGYGLLLIDMEKGISLLSVGTGQQRQD
jgi:transposase-like protein